MPTTEELLAQGYTIDSAPAALDTNSLLAQGYTIEQPQENSSQWSDIPKGMAQGGLMFGANVADVLSAPAQWAMDYLGVGDGRGFTSRMQQETLPALGIPLRGTTAETLGQFLTPTGLESFGLQGGKAAVTALRKQIAPAIMGTAGLETGKAIAPDSPTTQMALALAGAVSPGAMATLAKKALVPGLEESMLGVRDSFKNKRVNFGYQDKIAALSEAGVLDALPNYGEGVTKALESAEGVYGPKITGAAQDIVGATAGKEGFVANNIAESTASIFDRARKSILKTRTPKEAAPTLELIDDLQSDLWSQPGLANDPFSATLEWKHSKKAQPELAYKGMPSELADKNQARRTINDGLTAMLYGVAEDFAPEMAPEFAKNNRVYGALKTFEKTAPKRASVSPMGEITKDLNTFRGLMRVAVPYGAYSINPALGAVAGAQELYQIAKNTFPSSIRKGILNTQPAKGSAVGQTIRAGVIANQPKELLPAAKSFISDAKESPQDFLDKKISKAESKMDNIQEPAMHPISMLADAVIKQESAGNAQAVSSKGAQGLMQLMPATAKEVATELGVTDYDLKDPTTNRKFGEYYLAKMLNTFKGDLKLALAAYNAGPGKVREWISQYGPTWEEISAALKSRGHYAETVHYVPTILRNYENLQKMA